MKRDPLPRPTETELIRALIRAAKLYGIVLERSNVAAFANPRGQYVRCGIKGDPDLRGALPTGRALRIEAKRPGFDPVKLRGKARDHFGVQIARMRELNARGEAAFWVANVNVLARALDILRDDPTASIRFDVDYYPVFTHKETS